MQRKVLTYWSATFVSVFLNVKIVETKEYFEKVMQDFNQNRKGRSLRKYCSDEGGDYKRLSEYKRLARIQRRAIQDVYL